MRNSEIRTALFISGSGTTADAVMQAVELGELPHIRLVGVVSSNPLAGGLVKAQERNVPAFVVDRSQYNKRDAFGEAILELMKRLKVDFISQNGWLPLTPAEVVETYRGRIINQHPGPLDPGHADFGGKGMYGSRVTAARLAYIWTSNGEAWTESTIHHVTPEYDKGELIRVLRIAVPASTETITIGQLSQQTDQLRDVTVAVQRQLLPIEHQNVLDVLEALGEGNLPEFHRQERLIPDEHANALNEAKQIAITVFPEG